MKRILSGILCSTLLLTLIISGCAKTETSTPVADIPNVLTINIVSDATQTTAQSGGIITYNSSIGVTAYGSCWSATNQNPTIADSKTSNTSNTATTTTFTNTLTGLTANTTYYVRAYASNSDGTAYGAILQFKTNATPGKPTGTVTTFAGSTTNGFTDGAGTAARFDGPTAIAFNTAASKLYIGDTFNNAIRTSTTSAVVATLTNPALGYINGPLSSALFYGSKGMSFDAAGNAYVADMGNNVVRKITPAGVVTTLAGNGTAGYLDGNAAGTMFNSPQSVAVDATGNVYVADRGNNMVRKITTDGLVQSLAGYPTGAGAGYIDAAGANARFNYPAGIAINPAGTQIYVADKNNSAIRIINIADATVTTLVGGLGQQDLVGAPVALTFDAAGNLFIVDQAGRILEITINGVLYTIAGSANAAGNINGVGTATRFSSPQGITIDGAGNLYVTDYNNNLIRKVVVTNQ